MPKSNLPIAVAAKLTQNESENAQMPKPYTQYTIFFRLERMRLLREAGFIDDEIRATLRPGHFDQNEHPRPAKYRDVEMPPFWYSSFAKNEHDGKRKHTKKACRFPLKELSQMIAANWKEIDEETSAYTKRLADMELTKYSILLKEDLLKSEEAEAYEIEEATLAKESSDCAVGGVHNFDAALRGQSDDSEEDIRQFQASFFPDEPNGFPDVEGIVPIKSASIPSRPVSEGILKRAQLAERFNKAQYYRIHQMQSGSLTSESCCPKSILSEGDEFNFDFPRAQDQNSCFKRSSFHLEEEHEHKVHHPPVKRRASVGYAQSYFEKNNNSALNSERPLFRRGSIATSAPAGFYAHDIMGGMQLKNQGHQHGMLTAIHFQDHSSEKNDFTLDIPAFHSSHSSWSNLTRNPFSQNALTDLGIEDEEYHLNDGNLVEENNTLPFKYPGQQPPVKRRASVGCADPSFVDRNKRGESTEQLKIRSASIADVPVDLHAIDDFEHHKCVIAGPFPQDMLWM
mmetsp:Transcript_7231/g.14831  ORF Transcript_7231/g.14831 Transcript_7231/m.14831 type:complete len:512 (+) Transcript_7231:70-1605(+)